MSTFHELKCPKCGAAVKACSNPFPTVDALIYEPDKGIVLIDRKFEPFGWALPGGFVDYGETVEAAAVREAFEETGLRVTLQGLLGIYSDPSRDPRVHTITTVFEARAENYSTLTGGDDAKDARFFPLDKLPANIMFGHDEIIADFMARLARMRPEQSTGGR